MLGIISEEIKSQVTMPSSCRQPVNPANIGPSNACNCSIWLGCQNPVQVGGSTTVMGPPGAGRETGQLCGHRKRPYVGAGVELGRGATAAADGYDEGAVPEAKRSAKVWHVDVPTRLA